MKYAVEMGSGTMINIPALIKIGADIQKLIGTESQTHRQTAWLSRKPTFVLPK
jgi:hypothetical protein